MALPLPLPVRHHNQTHGMSRTRVYKIWEGMHSRCRTPSATGYNNYGGKEIRVCERWHSFEAFLSDMGEPGQGTSLDRVDGAKDYSPENCRWASRKEQNRNQFDLQYIEFGGKRQCLSAWAEEVGSTFDTLKARINRGWPMDRVLMTPVRAHKTYERRSA